MTNHISVLTPDDLPWKPLGPGIEMKILNANETSGCWSVLIRMLPGSRLTPHRHIGASEFLVLKGKGSHPQAGNFKPGDYAYERAGAVHTEVRAEEEIVIYMISHGAGEFLKPDGSVMYVSDAAYIKKQTRNDIVSSLLQKTKYFFFIYLWKIYKNVRAS